MEFMLSKSWIYFVAVCLLFSCNNSESFSGAEIEDEFASLPQLNTSKNKSIDIKLSGCSFDRLHSSEYTLYKSSITNGEVKLLLGSTLSCDFKNGAFIKESINTSDTLVFEIYQKGTKLSNKCECYFYYEITMSNKTKFPSYISMGDKVFTFDLEDIVTNSELEKIENKLNN